MKKKMFTTLGLMSGTSMDGVDLSLIKSDGYNHIEQIYDEYYEFSAELQKDLIILRDDLINSKDLKKKSVKINDIEKKFTLFNVKIVNDLIEKKGLIPDLIGFHGQTIFHYPKNKISKQIGDGHLLSQLTKCSVINKFRQRDLNNNGQGAPLTPIFHYLISKKINNEFNINYPINIINIGGITNVTSILNKENVECKLLPYEYNMQDMTRFEVLGEDMLHTKYGWVYHFNAGVKPSPGVWLEHTYKFLYDNIL